VLEHLGGAVQHRHTNDTTLKNLFQLKTDSRENVIGPFSLSYLPQNFGSKLL